MKDDLLFVLHDQDKLWIGNFSIFVHIKFVNGFLGLLHLKVEICQPAPSTECPTLSPWNSEEMTATISSGDGKKILFLVVFVIRDIPTFGDVSALVSVQLTKLRSDLAL